MPHQSAVRCKRLDAFVARKRPLAGVGDPMHLHVAGVVGDVGALCASVLASFADVSVPAFDMFVQ